MNKMTNDLIKECAKWWADEAIKKITRHSEVLRSIEYYDNIKAVIKREVSNYLEAQDYESGDAVILETGMFPKGALRLIQDNLNIHANIFPCHTITSILHGNLYIIQNAK